VWLLFLCLKGGYIKLKNYYATRKNETKFKEEIKMSRNFKTGKGNRTNYIYYGADGRKTVLKPGDDGVTEAIIETLHSIDDEEVDNKRRETEKHYSLDDFNDKEETGIKHIFDVEYEVLTEIERKITGALVHKAVSMLKPQQKDLIYALYISDNPMSQAEYAENLGIDEPSVQQKARRAKIKLKEIIEDLKK